MSRTYYEGRKPTEYMRNTADLERVIDTVPPPTFDMKGAACRGSDMNLFFEQRAERQKVAKAICSGCPIKEPCLDYAMEYLMVPGIWGGTSQYERERIAREKRRAA